jgi:hypothetical protein
VLVSFGDQHMCCNRVCTWSERTILRDTQVPEFSLNHGRLEIEVRYSSRHSVTTQDHCGSPLWHKQGLLGNHDSHKLFKH